MLEIMILYVIYDYELTMYYIRKKIHEVFGEFSKPSIGAIKPALTKLEKSGFIKSRKTFSEGGRLTGFYSVTSEGKKAFKSMIIEDLSANPVQIKSNAAIKIIASSVLQKDIQKSILSSISRQIEIQKFDAEKKLQKGLNLNPYQRILVDNLILEYENYIKLIDKLGK